MVMRHQKNRNLNEKIALNLPKNMHNDFKENCSRAANGAAVRSSNDSNLFKKSYDTMMTNNDSSIQF